MKKKIIIAGVVLVLIGIASQGGSDDSSESKAPSTESVTEAVTEAATVSETTEGTTSEAEAAYSTAEGVEEYKASCVQAAFSYNDILRYEDNYKGNDYCFTVTIAQVMDIDNLRAIFDEDYNDIIIQDKRAYDTVKILADDEVTVYARYVGSTTITRAVTGVEETVPCFDMYAADIAGVTDTEYYGTDMSDMNYEEIYGDVLLDYAANDEYSQYSLYDINNDGRKELIVYFGTGNIDFYTVSEIGAVSCIGTFEDDLVFYEAEDGDGLYGVFGIQGVETVYSIKVYDEEISIVELWTKEVDEYYENDNPLDVCSASDTSLLEKGITE